MKFNHFFQLLLIVGLVLLLSVDAALAQKESEKVLVGVAASAEKTQPIPEGARVPNAALYTSDGEQVLLSEILDPARPLVVVFYRGRWCSFCIKHLEEISSVAPEIQDEGFELVAISMDSPANVKKAESEYDFPFQLYSDSPGQAARAFGLAFQLDEETHKMYKESYDLDITSYAGLDHRILPLPAVYIVGTDGVVKFKHANPDYKTRLGADKILEAVRLVSHQ
jgi:peroxiredoxin